MAREKLEWHTERHRVDALVPHEKNPRTISPKQIADLKRSLLKFNLVETPAINLDGTILAGHQRVKILKLLGRAHEEIDVRVPNRKLTPKEAEQYLISSNALGGDWDLEKLKSFEIDTLLAIGFDEAQLAQIWDGVLETEDDYFDVEVEIKKIRKPKSKPGDLYVLGSHKILVGDASDPGVYKRLLGNERASMIYVDPIYNIGLDYNRGVGGKQQYGGSVNDKRTDDEYRDLLNKSLANALDYSRDDVHVFTWCDESYVWLLQSLYKELGVTNRRICTWIKGPHNPTPTTAFNKCMEICVYVSRPPNVRHFLWNHLALLEEDEWRHFQG